MLPAWCRQNLTSGHSAKGASIETYPRRISTFVFATCGYSPNSLFAIDLFPARASAVVYRPVDVYHKCK